MYVCITVMSDPHIERAWRLLLSMFSVCSPSGTKEPVLGFDFFMYYNIKSENNSYVPHGLQTENVLSCEIIFWAEMAHKNNGFFLCTGAQPQIITQIFVCMAVSVGLPLQ